MPDQVRRAVVGDVSAILRLIGELAEYENLSSACVATEELLMQHLFGADPVVEALVAEWRGCVVGYAIFFRTFSTFLAKPGIFLEDLYVRREHRGKGLGKAMLTEVCRLAVRRGYGRVEWAVLKWNEPSIGFYKSLGALPLSEWEGYRLTGDALGRLVAPSTC